MATAKLLAWCKEKVQPFGVKINNFTTDWKDGLAFCALISSFRPELIDFDGLKKENAKSNLELALSTAEKIGIARLIEPSDLLIELPEKLTIETYLSSMYHHFSKTAQDAQIDMYGAALEGQLDGNGVIDWAAMDADIAELNAKVSELNGHKKVVGELQAETNEAKNQLNQVTAELDRLQQELMDAEKQKTEIRNQLKEKEGRLQRDLARQQEEHETEIAKLQAEIEMAKKGGRPETPEQAVIRKKLEEQKAEQSKITGLRVQLQKEMEDLRKQLENDEKRVASLSETVYFHRLTGRKKRRNRSGRSCRPATARK